MRVAAIALLAIVGLSVSGCVGGCEPKGGLVSWEQPGVLQHLAQQHTFERTTMDRGWPVPQHPSLDHRFGNGTRLWQTFSAAQDHVYIRWIDAVQQEAGVRGATLHVFVSEYPESGPGAEPVRAAAVALMSTVGDEAMGAWAEEALSGLRRGQSKDLEIPFVLRPLQGLVEAVGNGTFDYAGWDAQVEHKGARWRVYLPLQRTFVPGIGGIDIVPTDRIIIRVDENPTNLDHALQMARVEATRLGIPDGAQLEGTFHEMLLCRD